MRELLNQHFNRRKLENDLLELATLIYNVGNIYINLLQFVYIYITVTIIFEMFRETRYFRLLTINKTFSKENLQYFASFYHLLIRIIKKFEEFC